MTVTKQRDAPWIHACGEDDEVLPFHAFGEDDEVLPFHVCGEDEEILPLHTCGEDDAVFRPQLWRGRRRRGSSCPA